MTQPQPPAGLPVPPEWRSTREQTQQDLLSTQQALRRANERMEGMLESLTDGFCAVDKDWRITYINARAIDMAKVLHTSRAALLGKALWDEFPELRGGVLEQRLRQASASGKSVSFEFYVAAIACWLDVRVYPGPEGLTIYFQDITRRKADERALVEGNSRLQLALSAGRLGDWRWDSLGDTMLLGERAAALFGLADGVPHAWPQVRACLAEGDREAVRSALLHAFSGRSDLNIECKVQRADGVASWIALAGRGDYGGAQQVSGMTGVVQDISTRKSAEDTLRQSEEMLRTVADSIPQLAWMAEADGNIVWFNKRWYDYTGSTPEQMMGWGWQSTHDPAVLPQVLARWHESVRTGEPFEMEFPLRGADGQYRWFLTRVNAVRDRLGHVLRWFGTNTDVDQVQRVQQALREETHVLELLNSTGNALASQRDVRSLLQTVTDAATGISGARFGAFFYHSTDADGDAMLLHTLSGATPEQFEQFGVPRATGLFGPSMRGEGVVRSDDVTADPRYGQSGPHFGLPRGHPRVRSYLAVPVVARSGEVFGCLLFGHPEAGIFTERTERIVTGIAAQAAVAIDNARLYEAAQKAADERKVLLDNEREVRAEAERNSQMKDEFLATLSHELRTPLSAILGWSQVLRRGARDQADLARGLQTIERNARAQAQLIEDLLDMSRITSGKVLLDMQAIPASQFINAAIETVRPAADAKQLRIVRHYASDVGKVAGDPGRLQQVIWNLLSNAIKFTPRGGEVRVAVAGSAEHALITVSDTGAGIAQEFLGHVFERFRQGDASTTRSHGGLGLGLSIVKHLVEQHGGTVQAASAGPGKGASFMLTLPLARADVAPARAGPHAAPAPVAPGANFALRDLSALSVLVVDDEADARDLIKRILSDCHADVTTAATASEALSALAAAPPDVLVSDLGMPGVDGFELLARVRALDQAHGGNTPAIALTAFAHSEDRRRALEAGFWAHVAKPVEPAELIATVASLGRPGG